MDWKGRKRLPSLVAATTAQVQYAPAMNSDHFWELPVGSPTRPDSCRTKVATESSSSRRLATFKPSWIPRHHLPSQLMFNTDPQLIGLPQTCPAVYPAKAQILLCDESL